MIVAGTDSEISIKGISLVVKKGVFNPNPISTNSTLMILNNLPNVKNKKILDVGCGTGIIGIFCALNGAEKVVCVDVDKNSLENTKENIIRNKVEEIVEITKSDLFNNVEGKFDYIFGNLPINDKSWDLDISTVDLMKKFLSNCSKYLEKEGKVYFTWNSSGNLKAIKDYLVKENYGFKESVEDKLGEQWYLFEVQF